MAGRALAFSDPEIVRLAREEYVAVAADDWYQRRRQDPEGEFFRAVAEQGPQKGEGGATRQGIYCLTAGGQLLGFKNAGQNPQVMRAFLQEALARWQKLPLTEREPGGVKVGSSELVDRNYSRTPPPGGLILKVYTRALDGTDPGRFEDAVCKIGGGDEAGRDHLWLTEAESRSIIPANPKKGDRYALPQPIGERIARFHLVDNTRGEPPFWRREDWRSGSLDLIVEEVARDRVHLRLEGKCFLRTDLDAEKARRGFEAVIDGHLVYERGLGKFSRFDLVAIGPAWGSGPYTPGERPGRTPLGVAFELASAQSPADWIAPQAAREIDRYFGKN